MDLLCKRVDLISCVGNHRRVESVVVSCGDREKLDLRKEARVYKIELA